MKLTEKLDLILLELYKTKYDGKYYPIIEICQKANIPYDSIIEINEMGRRLQNDGYIKSILYLDGCSAYITPYGIEYCEKDSYNNTGNAIITNNYNIINSPNTNIVSQVGNSNISTINSSKALEAIMAIRNQLELDNTYNQYIQKEIFDCLTEIEKAISNSYTPKYAIKSLISIAGDIASIASYITTLGQFAGII